jgi:hypothetical protein
MFEGFGCGPNFVAATYSLLCLQSNCSWIINIVMGCRPSTACFITTDLLWLLTVITDDGAVGAIHGMGH